MLRVLGRVTSINVRKVLWTLDELGETYEREDWGLPLRDPKVPQFLTLNPNGTVPVLIEADGFAMWESNAVMVYLAQTRGRLLPGGGHELGLALQWLGWQSSELNPPWMYAIHALVRKTPGYDDPEKIAESIARWSAKMRILEAELAKGRPFIAGADFSLADIALGLSIHRWFQTPFEHIALPAVSAYYALLRSRPAGRAFMPEGMS
ncbi:MAG: glutathione S-transferase N-terminal domain-containing protein [Devosia sp.]|nr:glutathione S-transferase N-terminal domain-containing protein [Devosia sp.]